jgi:hypothetical protein
MGNQNKTKTKKKGKTVMNEIGEKRGEAARVRGRHTSSQIGAASALSSSGTSVSGKEKTRDRASVASVASALFEDTRSWSCDLNCEDVTEGVDVWSHSAR